MIEIFPMNKDNYKIIGKMGKENLEEAWSEETLFNQLKNPHDHTFIAYFNGTPAGFLSLWIVADQGEINNIAVDKDFRRKGIGNALIQKMITDFTDVNSFYLEVRKSNENAISLYKKNGFKICGERKNFYKNPTENALLMCLICRDTTKADEI